jgi:hypothetical protein
MLRNLTILTSMLVASTVAVCVAAPSTAEQRTRVEGALYVMPGGFVIDHDSGQTVLLSLAIVLSEESHREWLTGVEQHRVRVAVNRTVSATPSRHLVVSQGRRALASRLRREIRALGLPVESVLIPDLAVKSL